MPAAGTVVQVFPGLTTGTVRSIGNNQYCLRERGVLWRKIEARDGGVFQLESLVNGCSGHTVFKPAVLTMQNNDEVRLVTVTNDNKELVQVWRRMSSTDLK